MSDKEEVSYIERQQSRITEWFLAKGGWIYFMVFIMGILLGGLIWK
jgi:hypothetical protein